MQDAEGREPIFSQQVSHETFKLESEQQRILAPKLFELLHDYTKGLSDQPYPADITHALEPEKQPVGTYDEWKSQAGEFVKSYTGREIAPHELDALYAFGYEVLINQLTGVAEKSENDALFADLKAILPGATREDKVEAAQRLTREAQVGVSDRHGLRNAAFWLKSIKKKGIIGRAFGLSVMPVTQSVKPKRMKEIQDMYGMAMARSSLQPIEFSLGILPKNPTPTTAVVPKP